MRNLVMARAAGSLGARRVAS